MNKYRVFHNECFFHNHVKKELKSILEAKIGFKVSFCIWHFDNYKFEFEKNVRKEKIMFLKNQQLFKIFWKYIE